MNYFLKISYVVILTAALSALWRWPLEVVVGLAAAGTVGVFIFTLPRWQKF